MFVPAPYARLPRLETRRQCTDILIDTAKRHNLPPALIAAHVRSHSADRARHEVMLRMLHLRLTRGQVALAFGRDLRRVRRSVIGQADYSSFDLFAEPLAPSAPKPKPSGYRLRYQQAVDVLRLAASESPTAARWLSEQES